MNHFLEGISTLSQEKGVEDETELKEVEEKNFTKEFPF
jgi:hypothetical protein